MPAGPLRDVPFLLDAGLHLQTVQSTKGEKGMEYAFLWGILTLISGAFMLVYGATLFRFVLAFAGFFVGFMIGMWIPAPSQFLQFLIALAIGAAGGIGLYFLVRASLYLAGALLGLVAGSFLAALLGLGDNWLTPVLSLGGAALGTIFGRSLGEWVKILAAAATGAYASVIGLNLLFNPQVIDADTSLMPRTGPAIAVFIVLVGVSILAQSQIIDLRRRLLNR